MKVSIHLNSYQHWVIFAYYTRIHPLSILTPFVRIICFFKVVFFFANIWQESSNVKFSVHFENVDKLLQTIVPVSHHRLYDFWVHVPYPTYCGSKDIVLLLTTSTTIVFPSTFSHVAWL